MSFDIKCHTDPRFERWCMLSSLYIQFNYVPYLRCSSQLPGRKQTAGSGLEVSGVGSGSLESAQNFLQDSLIRVSALQNLETPGAQDLLEFTIRYRPLMHYHFINLRSFSEVFVWFVSHTEICSGWGNCRRSWPDLQISVPHTCTASCCLPKWIQI